jgi:hypothetical protein
MGSENHSNLLVDFGGPRGDRTPDLLIAKEPEGQVEKVREDLIGPQATKRDESETG